MSKTVIAKLSNLSRADWLKLRKRGIGGSDAAAVCGMNRWRGPLDVYLDKTNTAIEDKDNAAMYWGRVMEPVLREEFGKRSGLKVEAVPYMFACKEYPYMLADIDGIAHEADGSVSLLEIKTANGFAAAEWDNGLPPEYYVQIQHYLAVCELQKAYVIVLIGGNDFRVEEIDRDEETIQTLIAMEQHFWQTYVMTKTPPEADATSGNALNTLYPASNGTSVILPADADALIQEISDCKILEEDLKKKRAEKENQLKAMLKKAECAKTPAGYSIRWKSSKTNRLDTATLKAEHPELVEKYTKTTSYRRFSITAPKESK